MRLGEAGNEAGGWLGVTLGEAGNEGERRLGLRLEALAHMGCTCISSSLNAD